MIPTKSFSQRIDGETSQAQPNGDFVVHFVIFSDKNRTFPTKKGIFLFEKFSHSIWGGEVPFSRRAKKLWLLGIFSNIRIKHQKII